MPKPAYVAAYAAVVFAAYAGWLLAGPANPSAAKVVINLVSIGVVAVAAVIAALAAHAARGRMRVVWLVLTVGLVGATVGETLWAYYKLRLGSSPFPSPADFAYLMFPVSLCVALLLFPTRRSPQVQSRLLMDGIVMAGSLLIVSWLTVMKPSYQSFKGGHLELLVSLAYPVVNMVTFTVVAVVLARAGRGQRLTLWVLAIGVACMTVVESVFAYLHVEDAFYGRGHYLLDISWTAGILLVTVAVAQGSRASFHERAGDELPGWVSVWLPFLPLMLAGIAIAAQQPALLTDGPVLSAGAVLLAAVLVRQYLAVSEDRRLLTKLAEQSLHDPLTGLANRTLFNDRLTHALQQRQDGRVAGVLALDLNGFKQINDNLGHAVGDELLIGVGERLRGCVRAGETVARLGGDEFVVLVQGTPEAIGKVANRVVDAFDAPFDIDGREMPIRPSAGLAIAGPDDANGPGEDLLKRADMAMYESKRSGDRLSAPSAPTSAKSS